MARDPSLFWWFELLPLTVILVIGLVWHRRVESGLIRNMGLLTTPFADSPPTHSRT
jgi:CDP-diacylglycerol---serine O-phosphatidyltransferase